jgi:hypothetical protein
LAVVEYGPQKLPRLESGRVYEAHAILKRPRDLRVLLLPLIGSFLFSRALEPF